MRPEPTRERPKLTAFVGTSITASVVVRTLCNGPIAPRIIFSLACGVIGAGVSSFMMLLR